MISLISTHNSITTKHYANGKHEPAGETLAIGTLKVTKEKSVRWTVFFEDEIKTRRDTSKLYLRRMSTMF